MELYFRQPWSVLGYPLCLLEVRTGLQVYRKAPIPLLPTHKWMLGGEKIARILKKTHWNLTPPTSERTQGVACCLVPGARWWSENGSWPSASVLLLVCDCRCFSFFINHLPPKLNNFWKSKVLLFLTGFQATFWSPWVPFLSCLITLNGLNFIWLKWMLPLLNLEFLTSANLAANFHRREIWSVLYSVGNVTRFCWESPALWPLVKDSAALRQNYS